MKPEGLPPTLSALLYHSYWVYYQVADWLGRFDVYAEKWCWAKSKDILLPRTMDKKPTPDSLLNTIGYNCTINNSMLRLGCRKDGYYYSSLCGQCQMNAQETTHYSSGKQGENRRIQFRHEHIRLPKIQRLICIFVVLPDTYFDCIKLHYGVNKIPDFV